MPSHDSPSPGIFICYRREGSSGHAGRLFDHLERHYGHEQLFMDLEHLQPGADFKQVINDAVKSCDIMLVLIGQGWLRVRERSRWSRLMFWDKARRRLDNPNDYVRLEVVAALNLGVYVIPVLIEGAQMPSPESLPADLSRLSGLQSFSLSDQRWKQDVNRLIGVLDGVLGKRRAARERITVPEEAGAAPPAGPPPLPTPAAPEPAAPPAGKVEGGGPPPPTPPSPAPAAAAPQATPPEIRTPSGGGRARGAPGRSPSAFNKKRLVVAAAVLVVTGFLVVAALDLVSSWMKPRGAGTEAGVAAPPGPTPEAVAGKVETSAPPPGMVEVPGGTFRMGQSERGDGGKPAPEVAVKAFLIDEHEVTNEEYEKFVRGTGRRPPVAWQGGRYPPGSARHPVTGVTWDDAGEYARWAGKRLPTEEEWEFAARGTDGRRYPWGNGWGRGLANAEGAARGVVNVKSYEKGRSSFGLYDMAGNAWEWTSSTTAAGLCQLPPNQPPVACYVIRGGSYREDREEVTATYRAPYPARGDQYNYSNIGFRCAKDAAVPAGQK